MISQYLHETECLVFSLMSHGERDYSSFNVEFSDQQKLDVEEILHKFSNQNCTYMVSKPKIFIFPFCRGTIEDPGIQDKRRTERDHIQPVAERDSSTPEMPHISSFSDIKICYATIPRYTAFRDPDEGSWYVQIMCDVWSAHAHNTALDQLLKIVANTTSIKRTETGKMQTCSNEDRGFCRELFFNPGYYG